MTNLRVGYKIDEELYRSARSVIYRAHWKDDGGSVILKTLRARPAPDYQVNQFGREFEITHNLDIPGVIGCYELQTGAQRNVMVLEDFGGQSLDRLAAAGYIDLLTFLQIAYASSTSLAALHHRHIVHGNLSPSNILFNTENGQLKLIDFGCAIDRARAGESGAGGALRDGLELPYASPEMAEFCSGIGSSSAVDRRSDLYSLGVALYELLTGRL